MSDGQYFANCTNPGSLVTTLKPFNFKEVTRLDVLNIFKEQHRLCSPLDPEADPNVELSFDSTIDEWRDANDLISWRPLSRFLNTEFNISVAEEEWKLVLTPSSDRTLNDVCQLISRYSAQQVVKPVKLLGHECLSSAVFRTLKKYLQYRLIDVSNLRPSTLITSYFEKHFSEMLEQTTIISNGNKLFDQFELRRKKKGFLNYVNIFDKDRYTFLTGDIKTFRDLTLKIIEVNRK